MYVNVLTHTELQLATASAYMCFCTNFLTCLSTATIDDVELPEPCIEESLHKRAQLCDSGLPDPDMCLIDEAEEQPPASLPVWDEALSR